MTCFKDWLIREMDLDSEMFEKLNNTSQNDLFNLWVSIQRNYFEIHFNGEELGAI